jgi:hypothetical protein
VPGRYKTPTTSKKYKYNTKYDEIFDAESLVSNSNGMSGGSKSLHQSKDNLLATSTNNLNSIGLSSATSKKSTLISSKTEPIIDLIKTLELNGEIEASSEQKLKQKCSSEETNELLNMASAAIAAKPRMIANEKSDDIANTNDFVDEFINDYLTNTLNSTQSDYTRGNRNSHNQLANETNETSVNKSKSSSGSVKEKTKTNTIYNELTASELNEIEKCLNESATNNGSYYVNADNHTNANNKLIHETSSATNNNWLVYLLLMFGVLCFFGLTIELYVACWFSLSSAFCAFHVVIQRVSLVCVFVDCFLCVNRFNRLIDLKRKLGIRASRQMAPSPTI